MNLIGSYNCQCSDGFSGDGFSGDGFSGDGFSVFRYRWVPLKSLRFKFHL